MRHRRVKRLSIDELSLRIFDDQVSVDSGEPANQAFFAKNQLIKAPLAPSHTSSVTWKSQAVKEKEEYERVKQRVRHFAPEQFKTNARPGRGPSEISPQNVCEWIAHKKEMLAMAEAERQKDCKLLKALIEAQTKIPKHQRKLKSAFGKGGKIFKDGVSPVLALPTIWSAEYPEKIANWPGSGELQWNGDSRQNVLAKTKCGRFLPPPRAPASPSQPFQEQPFLRQLPFDQTGPIFSTGPRPDEVQINNANMNEDPEFEALGIHYLGAELMQEIGEWRRSFVSAWRQAREGMSEDDTSRYENIERNMDVLGYMTSPDMDGDMWYDENGQGQGWNGYQVWW